MDQLPYFREQPVRDLAWAVYSPNLIDDFAPFAQSTGVEGFRVDLTQQRLQWLRQLDRQPAPLLSALNSLKSNRLGLYFEALWQFFLRHDQGYELLVANLPVVGQQRTIGEFDLLFLDREAGNAVHLELATKFFLDAGNIVEQPLANWLGPNSRDRLDRKLRHLLQHQTKLALLPEGKRAIAPYTSSTIRRCVALKGWLFYRYSSTAQANSPHSVLNPSHNRGEWLPVTELGQICRQSECWHILPRRHWLSPASLPDSWMSDSTVIRPPQLVSTVATLMQQSEDAPLMLCGLRMKNDRLIEESRQIITGLNWPHRRPPDQVS